MHGHYASHLFGTSFLDKVLIDATNCLKDYATQICPFNWLVGSDGDLCRANDGYRGPCESILHGMSQISSRQKIALEKECHVSWPCVGLYDAEGPYLDPGALFATNPAAVKTMRKRLQHFLQPGKKCRYQRFINLVPTAVENQVNGGVPNADTISYDSFPRVGSSLQCERQCTLQGNDDCVFWSYFPLTFPTPMGGRCLMLSRRHSLVREHFMEPSPYEHLIDFASVGKGKNKDFGLNPSQEGPPPAWLTAKVGVTSGRKGMCRDLNAPGAVVEAPLLGGEGKPRRIKRPLMNVNGSLIDFGGKLADASMTNWMNATPFWRELDKAMH